jgi:hypothetical protein
MKKVSHRKTKSIYAHLHVEAKKVDLIEVEHRTVVTRGQEEWRKRQMDRG